MRNNTISGGSNNIIAGSNVTISGGVSNTFVWSDDPNQTFSPGASGAFYIDTHSGVGVNTTNPAVTFDSNGAVKF